MSYKFDSVIESLQEVVESANEAIHVLTEEAGQDAQQANTTPIEHFHPLIMEGVEFVLPPYPSSPSTILMKIHGVHSYSATKTLCETYSFSIGVLNNVTFAYIAPWRDGAAQDVVRLLDVIAELDAEKHAENIERNNRNTRRRKNALAYLTNIGALDLISRESESQNLADHLCAAFPVYDSTLLKRTKARVINEYTKLAEEQIREHKIKKLEEWEKANKKGL